ncbi:quinone oxidoreductase family protein [Thermocrispum agreste]|uniref:quinone oxidoreductase family protein n=1 Tax=Thermocrispum agreste TaxID=37925 RepID=UPI000422D386|nr:zinc-binding alcohol dehydrogenase family protein [Thermocrispum agreste]
MHAAVLTDLAAPPQYGEHPDPVAEGPGEAVVEVLAAPLHRLTRGHATGSHYAARATLPLVPGVDGVVRDENGRLWYAVLRDRPLGTFAERTVIDRRYTVPLPDDIDPVRIAAAMNPAMASWLALRRRVTFRPGSRVLVLGATGVAGRMAVQIARHLGASYVAAAGRNPSRLAGLTDLGADAAVTYDQIDSVANADVVLDFVWGEPSARAMRSVVMSRALRSTALDWIQIGSVAGQTLELDAELLRAARVQLCGSGVGSVALPDILTELPAIADAVHSSAIDVPARPVPLADVAETWDASSDDRVVYVP